MDDVLFTFNAESFSKAFQQMTADVSTLKASINKFASESGKEIKAKVTNSSGQAADMMKALASKVKGLIVAYAGYRAIMGYIPEIGRAFQHAGDIMLRNLFWPLRKLLIPMLQKLLDWTREHRAMFVKWGTYIANAFRVVWQRIKGIIDLLKSFSEGFMRKFEALFGKTTTRLSDLMNILIFKMTAVFVYIKMLLEPLFSFLGESFATLIKYGEQYVKGFLEGFGSLSPILEEFSNMWKELTEILGVTVGYSETFAKVWRTIGNIIGMVVAPALRGIVQIIDAVIVGIKSAIVMAKMMKASWNNDTEAMRELYKEQEKIDQGFADRAKERWGQQVDAWKEGAGKIKETWSEGEAPLPRELNRAGGLTTSVKSEMKVEAVNINVTTPAQGKQVGIQIGQGVAAGMDKAMRNKIKNAQSGVASVGGY